VSEILEFAGRRFAAGLFWVEPGAEVERSERRSWGWSLEWGGQTGWIPREAGLKGLEGVPSVAACVAGYLGSDGAEGGWVALLKADDDRFSVVRVQGGVITTGGDLVFGDAGAAMNAVEEARAEGADVYGTPGAVTDGGFFVELDVGGLPEVEREEALRQRGGRSSPLRVAGVSAAVLVLVLGGVWLIAPDWVFDLFGGRESVVQHVIRQSEEGVIARIDNGALVQACGAAQTVRPPYIQAWKLTRIECHGWFGESEVIGLRPELEGRAVMVVRWNLPKHYVAPLHRRIAEEHLGEWYLGSVVETSAWAVMPLGPVLQRADGDMSLSYLEFRREVDRHFGMQGGRIEYGAAAESASVTVLLRQGLGRIAALVADVPGLELVSLSSEGGLAWLLKARQATGFEVKASLFRQLVADGGEEEWTSF